MKWWERFAHSPKSFLNELDRHIEKDRAISEQIQNAVSTTGSVFLTALTWPRTSELPEWDKFTGQMHAVLEQGFRILSQLLEGTRIHQDSDELRTELPEAEFHGPYPEPIQNTLNLYTELKNQCRRIARARLGELQIYCVFERSISKRGG